MDAALQSLRANPEFAKVKVTVDSGEGCEGWFDFRRLERAFQNLLLNGFEAVSHENGRILVSLRRRANVIEIRFEDNGPGIPEEIRGQLFEPFVSSGKHYGTGLGLTVVQKIVEDHGGSVLVEKTSSSGTVFLVSLPLTDHEKTEQPGSEVSRAAQLTHIEP